MRSCVVALALFALVTGGAAEAAKTPASPCGDNVIVRRGDTLSTIARRCEVSEGTPPGANPGIQGSGDLRVGETLRVQQSEGTAQRVGTRINSLVRDANNAIGELADKVGSSVQDLLDKNPDLRSRLDRLGHQMGLTEGPPRRASLSRRRAVRQAHRSGSPPRACPRTARSQSAPARPALPTRSCAASAAPPPAPSPPS